MIPKIYNATINLRRTKSELAVKELMLSMLIINDKDDDDLKIAKQKHIDKYQEEVDYLKSKIVKQEKRLSKLNISE